MTPPARARRLFLDYAVDALDANRYPRFLAERLLEDGDSADLRWLTANVPEEALAAWLRERGGRRLSGRSRALWQLLLGQTASPAATAAEIWPW